MKIFVLIGSLLLSMVLADTAKSLLKPANDVESWRIEETDGAKLKASVKDDAIVFDVTAVDSTEWHAQAVQPDLDLKDGKSYTLKFKAMSPESRSIAVNAMIDQDDWHQVGLQEEVYLGKEYREIKLDFQASGTVPQKNRVSFILGQSKGSVHIKDLSLTEK